MGSGFCRLGFWSSLTSFCDPELLIGMLSSAFSSKRGIRSPAPICPDCNGQWDTGFPHHGERGGFVQSWPKTELSISIYCPSHYWNEHLSPSAPWREVGDAARSKTPIRLVSAPSARAQESLKFVGTKLQTDIRSHKSVLDSGPFPPSQLCCLK